jgi:Glycosyltransferase family 87
MLARRVAFLLCLAAMALWAAALPWQRVWAGHNDFMQLYTGGRLAGASELYSSDANRTIGEQLGYVMPAVQYVRLPYYAALLKPLAMLPYHTAYLVFQSGCLAAALAFVFLTRTRSRGAPWFLLISVPILTSFANGQDVVIVLALSAAAVYLDQAERPGLAGLCLALCTIKFHLFVFTPLALLMHRKWRFAAAAALGVALELAISFAVAGWRWPMQYAEFLGNPVLHPAPYVLPNVHGIAGTWVPLEVVLTLALAASTAYLCRRAKSFSAAFTLCVFAGLLVARHSYIQDCALLLLIPSFLQPESDLVRQLSIVLLSPFPYFLLMLDRPWGLITPILLLLWFVALAADACGLIPRRKMAEPVHGTLQWNPESLR